MGMILIALGKAALFACNEPFINEQFKDNVDAGDQTTDNNGEMNEANNQTTNDRDQTNNVDNHTIDDKTKMELDRSSFGSVICQVIMIIIGIVAGICVIAWFVMPTAAFIAFPYVKKWFLDKAAIKVEDGTSVEKRSWRVCSVSEVESTKIMIRITASAYIAYMFCGVVFSIGNTYFVQQASHMKYRIRGWKPPLQAILLIFMACKSAVGNCYYGVCIVRGQDLAHEAGTTGAMFSVICCTVAAAVERRRLHVVRRHGLLDLPDDSEVPMSAFWLVFQVIFLGVVASESISPKALPISTSVRLRSR